MLKSTKQTQNIGDNMADGSVNLPPGFHFSPTDEELVLHFLYSKVSLSSCHPNIIPDLDLSVSDPWKLNGMLMLFVTLFYLSQLDIKSKRNNHTMHG